MLNLASKIKKIEKVFLFILNLNRNNDAVQNIEKKLSIENNVIRYLTVKYEKLDLKKEYFGEQNKIMRRDKKKRKGKRV